MAKSKETGQGPPPSLDSFFARIHDAQQELAFGKGEECFFRGHPDATWPLTPTLLRNATAHKWSAYTLRDTEADLYWEFQARARELHDRMLSDWDVLIYMREHGVATRLLDWTETLGVAMWFAVESRPQPASPCIWLLNPYALNEKTGRNRDLWAPQFLTKYSKYMGDYDEEFDEGPLALYPVQRNQRLHAQRGYFTIHGERREPLDVQQPKVVRKVLIEEGEVPLIRAFLRHAGIDELALFPDLDTLARYLHRKTGITTHHS